MLLLFYYAFYLISDILFIFDIRRKPGETWKFSFIASETVSKYVASLQENTLAEYLKSCFDMMLSCKFTIYFRNAPFKEHLFLTAYVAFDLIKGALKVQLSMRTIFFNLIANSSKHRLPRSTLHSANILLLVTFEIETYIKNDCIFFAIIQIIFCIRNWKIKYSPRWLRISRVSKIIYSLLISFQSSRINGELRAFSNLLLRTSKPTGAL